jgi:peptide chain release factor 2
MAGDGFWDDQERVTNVGRERTRLKNQVDLWEGFSSQLEECLVAFDLLSDDDDPDLLAETLESLDEVEQGVRAMEFQKMLSGENDQKNAIVAINAGAGGTEAQDWAEMLSRMYLRWAEARGFEAEIMDRLPRDEAGIKLIAFTVQGAYAYGYLQAETGVHRLVRISPFDSQARRHTSFASIAVYPETEENAATEIDPDDLRVDVFRSSGAGGQHVNTTESAVRLTHLPTGIVVSCQSERSQHKNRANAMRLLLARIKEKERLDMEAERAEREAEKMEIAWGSQIRSYVLQPYQKIKDHRTGFEAGNVGKVLDGDLDALIESYLLRKSEQ